MIKVIDENSKLLRREMLDFSGGMHDSIDPIKLEDNQFSYIQNGVLYGTTGIRSLIVRNGLRPFNTNAPSDGDTTSIINLFEYRKNDGTNTLLVKGNASLEKVASPYTGAFTGIDTADSSTKHNLMLQYKDLAYIFDRNNGTTWYTNKVYDGTNYLDFGIAPCDNSGLVFTGIVDASGTFPAFAEGYYNYYVTFLYDDNTESSVYLSAYLNQTLKTLLINPNKNVAFASAYIAILISTIPIGNGRVIARKIYRTKVNGTTFYYLNTIWNNTETSYLDTTIDDDELTEEFVLPTVVKPQISKCAVIHKERLFNANLKDNMTLDAFDITTATGGDNSTTVGLARNLESDIKLQYKIAKMYIYPSTANTYSIVRGGLSTNPSTVTIPKDGTGLLYGKTTLVIPSWAETFNGYTGIFRTPNYTIYKVDATGLTNQYRIWLHYNYPLTVGGGFALPISIKAGDYVNIHNIKGVTLPDGDYEVQSVNLYTFIINYTGASGVSDLNKGGCYLRDKYCYVGSIKSNETSFVDTVSVCDTTNSIYTANSVTNQDANKNYPQTIIWTDAEKSEVFTGEDLLNNETGAITRLISEADGVLIFKENDIYKLFTNNESAYWNTRQLVKGVGCQYPYSIANLTDGRYIWYSDSKFYLWASGYNEPKEISLPIRNTLNSLSISEVYGAFWKKYNWAVFTLNDTNTALVYDLNFEKWYIFKKNTFSTSPSLSLYAPYVDLAGNLLFGSKYNRIYNYSLSSYKDNLYNETFADSNLHLRIKTKTFDESYLEVSKLSTKIYYGKNATLTNKLTLGYYKDLGSISNVTKSIAPYATRLTSKINVQNAQQFEMEINAEVDDLFVLKGMMFEFKNQYESEGWNFDS